MRAALILAFLVGVNASAQGTKAATKTDAKAPAPGTKVDTKQAAPATKTDTKAAAPGTKVDTKQATKAAVPAAGTKQAPATPAAQATITAPPVVMRETFAYAVEARRDPFVSLLTSDELRPTVADLRLTGILFDEGGRNSIAMMRDLTTDDSYRVRTGQVIGRMRVALIKRGVVIFSIEEFGLNRQDSLVLGDSTKVRAP